MSARMIGTIVVLLMTSGPVAAADPPAAPPPGMGRYIMVVRTSANDRAGAKPGAPGQSKKYTDPDVAKHGGHLVRSVGTWRIINLPLAAAKNLRADENVVTLQRVWTGESFDGWDETQTAAVQEQGDSATNAVDTDLSWGPKVYEYDGSGNVRAVADGGKLDTYTYDDLGRLKAAVVNGATQTFRYDDFGNIERIDTTGGPPTVLSVDPVSNRLADAVYDVAGNVVAAPPTPTGALRPRYVYDALSMITAVNNGLVDQRMIYTASDERIGVVRNELASHGLWMVRDFDGRPLRQYRGGLQSDWLWEQDWIYAGGTLVGTERGGQSGEPSYGRRLHYHLDHLGSVRMITSEGGLAIALHDYFPFGVEQTVSIQEELNFGVRYPALPDAKKFTGHERDFLGHLNVENTDYLDYMHARYYDPNWGRFLSVDPTWESADLTKPQSWNRYSYVLNNPINLTDPDGRAWNDIFKEEWWTRKFNEWFPPKQVAANDPNREAVRQAGYSDEQAERMANPSGAAQRGLNEAGATLAAEGTQTAAQGAVLAGPALLRAALKPFNAELTQVGRALTKHPEVVGLEKATLRQTLRTDAALNRAGADALKAIIRNGVRTTPTVPRYGQVVQIQIPGGYGARWYSDGRFIGFINP